MPLNTNPIYSGVGDIQWGSTALTAANTTYEASGSGVVTVFTASLSGSFVQRVRFKASGSTSATVARVYINNGGAITTLTNNVLFDEITLAAVTPATSTAATTTYELPMNVALPANYRILATIGVAQTTGGWYVSAVGGSYTTP